MLTVKCTLVGGVGVGKSSLVTRIVQNVFVDDYDPTIADSYRKILEHDGNQVVLEIIDTSEVEEMMAMYQNDVSRAAREHDVIVFVTPCFLGSTGLQDDIATKYEHLQRTFDTDKIPNMLIVRSKSDLCPGPPMKIDCTRMQCYEQMTCCAKTGDGVMEIAHKIIRIGLEAKSNVKHHVVCKRAPPRRVCSLFADPIRLAAPSRGPVRISLMLEDLAPLYVRHLVAARGLGLADVTKATEALSLYSRFLRAQGQQPGKRLIPTPAIRAVWLSHLIRPTVYIADCAALFGAGQVVEYDLRRDSASDEAASVLTDVDKVKSESGECKGIQLTAEMVAEDVAWLDMWEKDTGLKAAGDVPKDRLNSWRHGYERFLEMCAESCEEFSPPLHIDLMWHTHMVHTRTYLADLSSHFVEPLDHEPWPAYCDREKGNAAFLDVYEKRFGEAYKPAVARPLML